MPLDSRSHSRRTDLQLKVTTVTNLSQYPIVTVFSLHHDLGRQDIREEDEDGNGGGTGEGDCTKRG